MTASTEASPDAASDGVVPPPDVLRPKGFSLGSSGSTGWNLFDDDVPFPAAVIIESALDHNGATMRSFCDRHGVSLAPHGKTTMSPALFRRQLRDGAWAITAATTWQARAMRFGGVPRVLIANEVVVPSEIEWILAARAEGFEVSCYVDSLDGVSILNETAERTASVRPVPSGATTGASPTVDGRIPVYVELGIVGGRTGARTVDEAVRIAEAVSRSPHLRLDGVGGFEGIIVDGDGWSAEQLVCRFLDRIVEAAERMDAAEMFEPGREVILTAGGSAYFDHVVDRLSRAHVTQPVRVVIRSGCYITHDDGALHDASPMGAVCRTGHDDRLQAAIEVWGAVLSRPEPTRVVIGIGKRDASTDGSLPVVKKVRRRGSHSVESVELNRFVQVNDQHAFLDVGIEEPWRVGDLVGVGISHPCTTFDKWRAIPIVDDDYTVVEVAETLF